ALHGASHALRSFRLAERSSPPMRHDGKAPQTEESWGVPSRFDLATPWPPVIGSASNNIGRSIHCERHARGTEAVDERGAHRSGRGEDPEVLRELVERDAQRALAHHYRGRRIAGVAFGGDRRAAAGAVDLHLEIAAGAGLLARPLTGAREDAVEQPTGRREREAAGERAKAAGGEQRGHRGGLRPQLTKAE